MHSVFVKNLALKAKRWIWTCGFLSLTLTGTSSFYVVVRVTSDYLGMFFLNLVQMRSGELKFELRETLSPTLQRPQLYLMYFPKYCFCVSLIGEGAFSTSLIGVLNLCSRDHASDVALLKNICKSAAFERLAC